VLLITGTIFCLNIEIFFRSSSFYISPQTVKLPPNADGKICTFQYVPIIDLVKAIVSQPGFKLPSHRLPDISEKVSLYDITDGDAYRKNKFFIESPDALGILVYADEHENCNPIGASKGVHKVSGVV
jgi:hypothetical protein